MSDRKKRIVLIGRTAAGKTTLCQKISNQDLHYHKTQTVQIVDQSMIDTPGEYLERRYFRGTLMVISTDADIIVMVQDPTEGGTMFPPSYHSQFAKESIGVITKKDIATEEQIKQAKHFLQMAGASRLFLVSSYTGEGIDELLEYIGY